MFKVLVKNLQGQETHGAIFETLEQAQQWIDQVKPTGAWGKIAYTEVIPAVKEPQEVIVQPRIVEIQEVVIKEAILDEEGNVIEPEIKEQVEVVIQEEIKEIQLVEIEPERTIDHSDEFTIEIIDISEQISLERKLQIRKEKRLFGESIIDRISEMKEKPNVNRQDLENLILDQDLMIIREFLWNGLLKSAYEKILSTENKMLTVFSEQDLNQIKSELLSKLEQLGEI